MLTLGRKGTADENRPQNQENRARKRKGDEDRAPNGSAKRSRSTSSNSSTSISTISTNLSRSPTPSLKRVDPPRHRTSTRNAELGKRRRRSTSSSPSNTSEASARRLRKGRTRDNSRNTRRRRCATSPDSRGRERHYHNNMMDDRPDHDRRFSRSSRSSSSSGTSESFVNQSRRHSSEVGDRDVRKRRSSGSPDSPKRGKDFHSTRSHRRTQSRGESRDRSEVARSRRSMTPGDRLRQNQKYLNSSPRNRGPHLSHDNDRYASGFRGSDHDHTRATKFAQPPWPPRKERSLSPFSKRLALTQAMNRER